MFAVVSYIGFIGGFTAIALGLFFTLRAIKFI
jgi:hypothetical protein